MQGWQVAQMWLSCFKSHVMADTLWALMYINEMGAIILQQYSLVLLNLIMVSLI